MNIEDIREFCIGKDGVTEEFPFDQTTLVYKVMGKIFLLSGLEAEIPAFNVKCDPDRAIELREEYSAITSGYHMNNKHWNTIVLDGSVSDSFLYELIDHSYELVVDGLTRAKKHELLMLQKGRKPEI